MRVDDPLRPFEPSGDEPFDLAAAGHLLRRAAIGGSLEARRRAVEIGPAAAVAALFERGPGQDVDALTDVAAAKDDVHELGAFRTWRLLVGRERVRERMSLLWHGHFATSVEKVGDVPMFARHLAVFDEHGLGRFDELLGAVSRDAAMIRWLDNESNAVGHPNENFARELLELFALGRGAYTERDVREAARAFTGWTIRDGVFWFDRRRHDGGEKEVLGRRGELGGEDVVVVAASHPASARFVAHRLCAELVHPEPLTEEVDAVATFYADADRDVRATVRAILGSRMFFSARARRSRVKTPLDLVVGTVRSLGASASPRALYEAAAAMGQRLCAPPSVEGWPRESAWLTSATWLARANFAAHLFAGRSALSPDADALLGEGSPDERATRAIELLHDGVVAPESRAAVDAFIASPAARGRGAASRILHAMALLPEGQLL